MRTVLQVGACIVVGTALADVKPLSPDELLPLRVRAPLVGLGLLTLAEHSSRELVHTVFHPRPVVLELPWMLELQLELHAVLALFAHRREALRPTGVRELELLQAPDRVPARGRAAHRLGLLELGLLELGLLELGLLELGLLETGRC